MTTSRVGSEDAWKELRRPLPEEVSSGTLNSAVVSVAAPSGGMPVRQIGYEEFDLSPKILKALSLSRGAGKECAALKRAIDDVPTC